MWQKIKCWLGHHNIQKIGLIDDKYNVEICKHCKRVFVVGDIQGYKYIDILIKALKKIPEEDLKVVTYRNVSHGWEYEANGIVVSSGNGYYLNGIRVTSYYGDWLIRTIKDLQEKKTEYERKKEIKNCVLKLANLLNVKECDYSIETFAKLLKDVPLEYVDRCYLQRKNKIDKYFYPALVVYGMKILYSGNRGSVYINEFSLDGRGVSLVLDAVKTIFERYDEEAAKNCILGKVKR